MSEPKRSPWQRLYEAAHRARARRFAARAARLEAPVLSIGNLHWGGTGKTPLVAAFAAALRDRGWRPAVLSRGYGRAGSGTVVVSRGSGRLVDPREAGDEPAWLAEQLPGVSVVVDARRARAGRLALDQLGVDLLLLDDGFSHLALARDVDLVVLPAADPLGGGLLRPGGRLREPLASLGRSSAVILSGADAVPPELAAALRTAGASGPLWASPTRVGEPRWVATTRPVKGLLASAAVAGRAVLAVAGIARPERFFDAARGSGLAVVGELAFRDHHRYPPRSLERIREELARLGASAVVTTSKDLVKLVDRLELPLLELPIEAGLPEGAVEWVDQRLRAAAGGAEP